MHVNNLTCIMYRSLETLKFLLAISERKRFKCGNACKSSYLYHVPVIRNVEVLVGNIREEEVQVRECM